jgi:hypothetical protein
VEPGLEFEEERRTAPEQLLGLKEVLEARPLLLPFVCCVWNNLRFLPRDKRVGCWSG